MRCFGFLVSVFQLPLGFRTVDDLLELEAFTSGYRRTVSNDNFVSNLQGYSFLVSLRKNK